MVPFVTEVVRLVLPQAYEINPEGHVPVNICIIAPDALKSDPIELKSIVAIVVVAVNLYQTSSSGVPAVDALQTGTLGEAVAAYVFVPGVRVAEIGIVIAFTQLSLAGGLGTPLTQTENSPLPGDP